MAVIARARRERRRAGGWGRGVAAAVMHSAHTLTQGPVSTAGSSKPLLFLPPQHTTEWSSRLTAHECSHPTDTETMCASARRGGDAWPA
eukprot:2027250-Rhodomonas_salina.1